MRGIKALFVTLVVALALPSVAVGQNAGDDQYADPFEEAPAQNAPEPRDTPERVTASPGTTTTAQAAPETPAQSGSDQLPYTGLDLVMLFVMGAVLLLSGVTVWRIVSRPVAAPR